MEQFPDLLELLKRIVTAAPPCKKHDEAVGRFESQAAKSKQADPAVTALVAQVSPAPSRRPDQGLVRFRHALDLLEQHRTGA